MKTVIFLALGAGLVVALFHLRKLLQVEKLPGNKEGLDRYIKDNKQRIERAQTDWSNGTITPSEKRWLLRLVGMSARMKVKKGHKNEGEVA